MSVALRIQKVFFWGVTSAAEQWQYGAVSLDRYAIIRDH